MPAIDAVLARRAELTRFVRSRVESDAVAEELVQSALLRAVEADIRADESAVAWMYRTLRNAVVDHYRRRDAAGRAIEELAASSDGEASNEIPPDERARTCACVRSLARSLKPEYAAVLEQVDVEERPIAEVASEVGITTNNATVRLHRARKALRDAVLECCGSCATHGCADCSCKV